jgi:hypothetical protein
VLKEAVEAHRSDDFALYIVWIPMVPTDSEVAARRMSAIFNDTRVKQFYDTSRTVGLSFTRDVFAGCVEKALATMPPDEELRPKLEKWRGASPGKRAMWDAFFVYGLDAEWGAKVPVPASWTKQTEFSGPGDGTSPTAKFWRDDCSRPPIASDWFLEVRGLMSSTSGRQ